MTQDNLFLNLRLYENGIDFINKSMESFMRAVNDQEAIEYKYALLLLATGTELILKSILENVHPLFIQAEIDGSENFSVKADNLVSRINKVYTYETRPLRITNNEAEIIDSIRKVRNNIIHKEVLFTEEKIPQLLYANTLFTLDNIVKKFKGSTLSSEVRNWEVIVDIEHIQNAYYKSAQGIAFNGISIPCPVCFIKKLVNKSGYVECLHCGSQYQHIFEAIKQFGDLDVIEDYFQAFSSENYKKGVTFHDCPDCGIEGYSWYDKNNKQTWCFSCGIISSSTCSNCEEDSLIIYSYDIDGKVVDQSFCINCQSTPEAEQCPNCFESDFALSEKIRIDIKKSTTFYNEVNLEAPVGSPFIEVSLCPPCYSKIERLEDKGIIELI